MRESRKRKILLGSFAILDSLRKTNPKLKAISVAYAAPDWARDLPKYEPLAPTKELVKHVRNMQENKDVSEESIDHLVMEYTKVLLTLDRDKVYHDLVALAGSTDFILLSPENSNEISHRFLIQKWFDAEKEIYSVEEIYSVSNAILHTGGA